MNGVTGQRGGGFNKINLSLLQLQAIQEVQKLLDDFLANYYMGLDVGFAKRNQQVNEEGENANIQSETGG